MPRVYLGDDPFIPGRRIEVDASGLRHGEECPICGAVQTEGGFVMVEGG